MVLSKVKLATFPSDRADAMAREILPQQLAQRLEAGESFYLLDVRQPQEHQLAALPGCKLIPLNELSNRWKEIEAPSSMPLVVYCHHGIRSQAGADYLEKRGFANVFSLAGGIEAWSLEVDPRVPRY
jgi:adenylyltransferase/sulfurtransferase